MANVITVTARNAETLVNLDNVISIAFRPAGGGMKATARIVTVGSDSNTKDAPDTYDIVVVGEEHIAVLRAELVRVGWLQGEPAYATSTNRLGEKR